MKYLCKGESWELVDQYTYQNWSKAVTSEGNARYSGPRLTMDNDSVVEVHGPLSGADIGVIFRFLGLRENANFSFGVIKTPEFVKFSIRGYFYLHDMATGETFKPVAKKVA
jgi:hypothetical protein